MGQPRVHWLEVEEERAADICEARLALKDAGSRDLDVVCTSAAWIFRPDVVPVLCSTVVRGRGSGAPPAPASIKWRVPANRVCGL